MYSTLRRREKSAKYSFLFCVSSSFLLFLHLGTVPTPRSYANWDYSQLELEKFKMNNLLSPKGELEGHWCKHISLVPANLNRSFISKPGGNFSPQDALIYRSYPMLILCVRKVWLWMTFYQRQKLEIMWALDEVVSAVAGEWNVWPKKSWVSAASSYADEVVFQAFGECRWLLTHGLN